MAGSAAQPTLFDQAQQSHGANVGLVVGEARGDLHNLDRQLFDLVLSLGKLVVCCRVRHNEIAPYGHPRGSLWTALAPGFNNCCLVARDVGLGLHSKTSLFFPADFSSSLSSCAAVFLVEPESASKIFAIRSSTERP